MHPVLLIDGNAYKNAFDSIINARGTIYLAQSYLNCQTVFLSARTQSRQFSRNRMGSVLRRLSSVPFENDRPELMSRLVCIRRRVTLFWYRTMHLAWATRRITDRDRLVFLLTRAIRYSFGSVHYKYLNYWRASYTQIRSRLISSKCPSWQLFVKTIYTLLEKPRSSQKKTTTNHVHDNYPCLIRVSVIIIRYFYTVDNIVLCPCHWSANVRLVSGYFYFYVIDTFYPVSACCIKSGI